MNAVYDERRLANAVEVAEPLASEPLPVAERCHLRGGHLRSGWSLEVCLPVRQPFNERRPGGLSREREREEDLLEHHGSLVRRVLDRLCEAGLLEVHDVLATTRCGTDKNHPPK